MMLPGFVSVVAAGLVIILNFDGSLRPPRDPMPGFRHTSDALVRRDGLKLKDCEQTTSSLASCSATVSFQHPNHEEILFAVGGKLLPIVPGVTAADTEYEGLLLGLKWLSGAYSYSEVHDDIEPHFSSRKATAWNQNDVLSMATTLIIRGDCKAVIDQLKSKSTPRKMENHYNTASKYIEGIRNFFFDVSFRELSIVYELIPRDENYFCDAICKLVTNQIQLDGVRKIEGMIRCHHLGVALDKLLHHRRLCHSSRLALACRLAQACLHQIQTNDARYDASSILHQLSVFFMDVSRQWSRIFWNLEDDVGKETLKEISVACKQLSQRCMALPRRFSGDDHDFDDKLLQNSVEIIFGKCTNSEHMTSRDLMSPYEEYASAIVKSCHHDESRRGHSLEPWHKHLLRVPDVNSEEEMWVFESHVCNKLTCSDG